jgi:aminoglycoside phosphotransferase (APT) family kinase protein
MLSATTKDWIERVTAARVVGVERVRQATSCLLHDIQLEDGSRTRHVMLRRFNNPAWVKREPDLALREGASLQQARRASLPAPDLIAVDAKGENCGVPASLVTKLPGEVVLRPSDMRGWLRGLAREAARINRIDAAGFRWKYRRYNDDHPLAVPAWSEQPAAWEKAISVVLGPAPQYRECFIHRDFHPSNILWQNGGVTGVVDWVNGCRGPAGIDVAWCRHNLANLHSVNVADEFLAAYQSEAGSDFEYHPYWDLMTVVELLPGPPSMYAGWSAAGHPPINRSTMRERVDAYVASVVARL